MLSPSLVQRSFTSFMQLEGRTRRPQPLTALPAALRRRMSKITPGSGPRPLNLESPSLPEWWGMDLNAHRCLARPMLGWKCVDFMSFYKFCR